MVTIPTSGANSPGSAQDGQVSDRQGRPWKLGRPFHVTLVLCLRDGAIIFDDLIGKLDVLRIECVKCGRKITFLFDGSSTELPLRPRFRL